MVTKFVTLAIYRKLFFLFIIETLALGELMKVNTFDQPAVEQVKVLTKKFLKLK